MKKVLIIQGHPDGESLGASFARHYAHGAREGGSEVRMLMLEEMDFDPVLHHGYKNIQDLEPDLKQAQEDILWADHVVLFFPVWWGGMPALLKGFFDRTILPGFGFKYRGKSFWQDVMHEKLLSGKSGHIIVTMDVARVFAHLWFGRPALEVKRTILGFCGISPIRITEITPVKRMSPAKIEYWKQKMIRYGQKGK